MPVLSPSRTVLLIADEGLGVYTATAAQARHVATFPWDTADFEDVVAETIARACGKKPVLILYDMVEQHYRKERVPRVATFDRGLIVERKLRLTFPSFPVRAALAMKEAAGARKSLLSSLGKAGAEEGKPYLFAAVPGSEALSKVMEAVQRSMAPVSGFVLLPVESSDMVRELSRKLSRKPGGGAASWVVFIGQQKSGGLRQIVTKNGELALTRMTPVADVEADAGQWVSDVLQEFRATMSYVSRFGYTAQDSLDVIVVSQSGAGHALGDRLDVSCNYTSLTPPDAGRLLGLRPGEAEGHSSEALHVAWAGRKSRFIMPMKAPDLERISWPRRVANFAALLLIVAILWLGFEAFSSGQSWFSTRSEAVDRADVLAKLDAEYKVEADRKAAMGFDVDLIQGTLQAYDRLQIESLHLLPLVRAIGDALAPHMSVSAFEVARQKEPPASPDGAPVDIDPVTGQKVIKPARYEAKFQMKFPPGIKPEEGVKAVNDLVDRLKRLLPGNDISITRQVANLSFTGEFEDESSSSSEKEGQKKEYEAEIVIKGGGR